MGMKKEVKKKWLKALTSGEYTQGKNALKTTKGNYCCLGVLCDIHRKTVKKAGCKWDKETNAYLTETGSLPSEVMKWAGIDKDIVGDSGRFKFSNGKSTTLAILNDDKGYGFTRIADVIKKYF